MTYSTWHSRGLMFGTYVLEADETRVPRRSPLTTANETRTSEEYVAEWVHNRKRGGKHIL